MSRPLPKYKNPPINEVFLGVSFEPLHKMKVPHIGAFWGIVEKDFPKCEHAPIVGDLAQIIEPETGVPIPRVWLINKEEDQLIQIQKNRFLFNWRKREKQYPSFSHMLEMFFKKLDMFSEFISVFDLGSIAPTGLELSYINHIPKGQGWKGIESTGDLIPDVAWGRNEERFLHGPESINWQAIFSLPVGVGKLSAQVKTATQRIDGHPLIILEIAARGLGDNRAEADIREWFCMAHKQIIFAFEDLTSPEIQKTVWGKINDA